MLSFGAETFIFQFTIEKYKDQDIQTYNFACFLYGCEGWSLRLRVERRLRVFENRVMRIFGPKGDEVKIQQYLLYVLSLSTVVECCHAHGTLHSFRVVAELQNI